MFDRAAVVFEQANFEDWLDALDNVIGDHNDQGDAGVLDIMQLRVGEMLDSLLLTQGVRLTEHATLGERLSVAEALVRIEGYEDKEALIREIESNETPQEVVAGLVALLADRPVEAVLACIEEVSEAVVAQLRSLIEGEQDELLEEVQLTAERIKAYEKFKIVFANDKRFSDRFAQFPQTYGLPFELYAKFYMAQQVEDDLIHANDTELAWRKVCVNLIGLGVLSQEGITQVSELAKRYLEQICTDLGQLTQLHIKLNNLLMEYNRAQT